jgi:serine/threonine protein phosphatase PrpC
MSVSAPTSALGFELSLLRCAAGTDVGMRREENQDAFGVIRREQFVAYFVCDGMGGTHGGALASRMAVAQLHEALNGYSGPMNSALITATIQSVNQTIFDRGRAEPAYAGMGTTLVGLIFTPESPLVVNVGDSRAYRIRGAEIAQISEDHTLVRELVESGAISPEDAPSHPVSHLLTRSLGPLETVDVACAELPEPVTSGDLFVLCSDGLYNYVPPEDILAVVSQNPIDDASQILINLANQRGGGDNITVLVIAVGEKPRRERVHTIPPSSDTGPELYVDEPSTEPVVPHAEVINEPPVLPPTVQEPVQRRAFRKTPFKEPRSYTAGPRLLPTALLLGTTLAIGVGIGSLVRSARNFSVDDVGGTVGLNREPTSKPEVRVPESQANPLATLAKQIRSTRQEGSNVLSDEPEMFTREKAQVAKSIERIQKQIEWIDSTSFSPDPSAIADARAVVTQLERAYTTLETDLDVASRSVTLWLGRQVAFGGEDISFDSLSDLERLGAYSTEVRDKVAQITALAYEFREKADSFELHPEDFALRAEVEKLRNEREQLKRTLASDIKGAISNALAASFKTYENLKVARDRLWQDLQLAKLELETLEVLASANRDAQQELKRSRQERLASEQRLLKDLLGRNANN